MGSETATDETADGTTDGTTRMTKSDGKTASKMAERDTTESGMTGNEEANGATVSPRFSGSSKVMTLKRGSSQTGKHGPMKVRA